MNRNLAVQLVPKLKKVLESCKTKDHRFVAIKFAQRALVILRKYRLEFMVYGECVAFNDRERAQGFIRL